MYVELSVVVPVYNEEDVLPLLAQRLRPVLDGLATPYEVVAVDDGCTDASAVVLQRIRHDWPQLRVIRLRANAGHQAAISAGLARARGDYMVTIDADLQDPPEVIEQMLRLARSERVDVVYGVRNDRSTDTAFKRGTARAFYATMRAFAKTEAPMDAGDFRLMSRATVDAVNALPEHHRVLRLVVPALGFPSAQVPYKREERAAGSSKYPLSKMIKLSFDSLTSHSMAPLRLASWFGLIGGGFALLILAYALISQFTGRAVAGWTSTVAAVASMGALQLICLGLLGEYVGRMYTMMQGRPTYFIAHDTDERLHHEWATEAGAEVTGIGDGVQDVYEVERLDDLGDLDALEDLEATGLDGVSSVETRETGTETEIEAPSAAAREDREPGRDASLESPRPAPRAAARGSFGHSASDPGDGNGRGVMDAELRQAVRRTSAKSVTPGRDLTGR